MKYPIVKAESLRVGDKVAVFSSGTLWTDLEVLEMTSRSVSLHVNDDELPMTFRGDSHFFFLMKKTSLLPKKLGAIIEDTESGTRYMLTIPNGFEYSNDPVWTEVCGETKGRLVVGSSLSQIEWVEIFEGHFI